MRSGMRLFAGLGLMALTRLLPAGEARDFEAPPQIKASAVVPAELMQDEAFAIDENVVASNFYFYFHATSTYGVYDVGSLNLLRIRAAEIDVLSKNREEPGKEEFARTVGTELTSSTKAAAKTVVTPVKTAKAVASGIKRDSQNAIDFLLRKNHNQPKDAFFIGDEKRRFACGLGLDVYSTNPAVQDFLTAHAKARAAGTTFVNVGFSIGSLVVPVLTPVHLAMTAGKYREEAEAKVDTLSALELYHYNDEVLSDLNVNDELRQRFLEYPEFTPRQKTEIIAALKTLSSMKDKRSFLTAALEFHPVEGVWPAECAAMLAKYDDAENTIVSVSGGGPSLFAQTSGGKTVVVFPADILYWNYDAAKSFENFAQDGSKTDGSRVCLISGDITPRARIEIERRGFVVRDRYLSVLAE